MPRIDWVKLGDFFFDNLFSFMFSITAALLTSAWSIRRERQRLKRKREEERHEREEEKRRRIAEEAEQEQQRKNDESEKRRQELKQLLLQDLDKSFKDAVAEAELFRQIRKQAAEAETLKRVSRSISLISLFLLIAIVGGVVLSIAINPIAMNTLRKIIVPSETSEQLPVLIGTTTPVQEPASTEDDINISTPTPVSGIVITQQTTLLEDAPVRDGIPTPSPTQIQTEQNVFTSTLVVDVGSRESTRLFFDQYYSSESVEIGWTGSHENCEAGTTSDAFRAAILQRINFFRAMAGVPANVVFSDEYNRKAQEATFMMSVNQQLNHAPPSSWRCYTEDGYQGASNSNLFLGINSVRAIDGYIQDLGANNGPVGHRRWLLYPNTKEMGTGDVPARGDARPANAIWVFDSNFGRERPTTRDAFVAWPPAGYVPHQIVYPRWSFSYPNAEFSDARVQMTRDGGAVSVRLEDVVDGFGDNTLVWEVSDMPHAVNRAPASDVRYSVTVQGIRIDGAARDFTYEVTVFDPGDAPAPLTPSIEAGLSP